MTRPTHPELVNALQKSGEDIMAHTTPAGLDLMHMAVGIAGEAGELLDAVKKHVFYNKPLDYENVVEELGDLEFYMEGVRRYITRMGFINPTTGEPTPPLTREFTLEANIDKLGKRYAGLKYTDQAAQDRADKA